MTAFGPLPCRGVGGRGIPFEEPLGGLAAMVVCERGHSHPPGCGLAEVVLVMVKTTGSRCGVAPGFPSRHRKIAKSTDSRFSAKDRRGGETLIGMADDPNSPANAEIAELRALVASLSAQLAAAIAQLAEANQTIAHLKHEVLLLKRWSFTAPDDKGDQAEALRQQRRMVESAPLLTTLKGELDALALVALPKSPVGQAAMYALKNWKALTVYVANGALDIDNNAAERELRPVAVGRKNYLFFGSERGGHTAATLYTVLASAKTTSNRGSICATSSAACRQ